MNKTSILYKDEVGWIKLILRIFSMNFMRISYSDTKREYIEPTRG